MSNTANFGFRVADCGSIKQRKIPNSKSAIRNEAGFTLIEVLLAMAILAVIITVVYGSFSTAGRNIEQAEEIRDETDVARTLISRISDEITNAYVSDTMNSQAQAKITVFYGKKEELGTGDDKIRHDSISLTTLTNWRRPDTKEIELWEVGYFFREKPEGQGYALCRREKRVLSKDVPALEGGDEYEITDKVQSLQLRYTSNAQNWLDDWDSRTSHLLPKVVEISLVLDTGKAYVTQVDIVNAVQAGY